MKIAVKVDKDPSQGKMSDNIAPVRCSGMICSDHGKPRYITICTIQHYKFVKFSTSAWRSRRVFAHAHCWPIAAVDGYDVDTDGPVVHQSASGLLG